MRDAVERMMIPAIDWDAVARAVRTLSSAEEEPPRIPPNPPMVVRSKRRALLTSKVNNRLSDFDTFDWD